MKRSIYILKLLLLITIALACKETPGDVQEILSKMTQDNQQKFQNVFNHYSSPSDSLKLIASYFLVANMVDYYSYAGKQLRDYNTIFEVLANKPEDFRENLPWYSDRLDVLFDSIENIYGQLNRNNFRVVYDMDVFTVKSFIEHIDAAFESWENPWSKKNVSFSDFCNYVLPYRNFNEPIEPWQDMFKEDYNWIYDSLYSTMDIIEVAKILNKDSELKFSNSLSRYIVSIPPSLLLKAKYGTCADNSNYKAMIMRAHGIPVSIDFIPQYGNDHNSHYWNSIMDNNGNYISFDEVLEDINASVAYKFRIAKVYRRTFTKNSEIEKLISRSSKHIPKLFQNPRFVDVTSQYVAVSNVKIKLDRKFQQNKYIYLGVFDNQNWNLIDYSAVDQNKNLAEFRNLGRMVIYLPMTYEDSLLVPVALPFRITEKGYIQYISPEEDKESITLTRKYKMHSRKLNWLRSLKGGVFQGSNTRDFSHPVDLASVSNIPGEHGQTLKVDNLTEFRYYRFLFSDSERMLEYEGDGASIAEIEFFDINGNKLSGDVFGSSGKKYNEYTPELCFDDNLLTFFEDARKEPVRKYVGLKLKNPQALSHIRYKPRTDLNSIQPGNRYKLYYWNNKNFELIEEQVANDTLLIFENIPKGAILWLRNDTEGTEERIFTYENNKQVWW